MTTIQPLPVHLSIGEKYEPAMAITDQAEADAYFEALVQHTMTFGRLNREQAEKVERDNLGYYAAYGFDRERVERLFKCEHPIFGKVDEVGHPSPAMAFMAGQRSGRGQMPMHPLNIPDKEWAEAVEAAKLVCLLHKALKHNLIDMHRDPRGGVNVEINHVLVEKILRRDAESRAQA